VSAFKTFFTNIGLGIILFFNGLFAQAPVYTGPRSSGININLVDWRRDASPTEVVGMDALGGVLYLFWLDDEGRICHGTPGVNGQLGPILLLPSSFAELRGLTRDESVINIEDLARLRNSTYDLGVYDDQGMHLALYRNQIWRERSVGAVFEDFRAIQSAYPIDINLSDSITPNRLRPVAMLRLNDYACSLTEYGSLPVPGTGLPGEAQNPSACLRKQNITGSMIANACRAGTLSGGLNDGYLRVS